MTIMSFVECPVGCDFPIENLPYGVFSTSNTEKRIGVAIGYLVLDLKIVASLSPAVLHGIVFEKRHVLCEETLNAFMSMGRPFWQETRSQIQNLLSNDNLTLQGDLKTRVFVKQSEVIMHLPAKIGDYSDFYSSLYHATNVGSMFRDPSNPLPPNWKHLPIAYHGRSSSILVSGTNIRRPYGQTVPAGQESEPPIIGPCKLMDFELEVAFFVGGSPTQLGERISMDEAEQHIFGFVLMNDWSARDIQKWEYFPLGPFLSKNMGTSISPWVVTLEALSPFLTDNFPQDPQPLPYLRHSDPFNFDINLVVKLEVGDSLSTVCQSNFKYLYWTPKQQLVHHATTGCPLNPGDLLASGTISGSTADSYGCLLELSWKGSRPVQLQDGLTRRFLADNDQVIITGFCEKGSIRIGFGECKGRLLPPLPM